MRKLYPIEKVHMFAFNIIFKELDLIEKKIENGVRIPNAKVVSNKCIFKYQDRLVYFNTID
jgi:hypothetical protein